MRKPGRRHSGSGSFATEDQALAAAARHARQSGKARHVFYKRGRWMVGTRPGQRGGVAQMRVHPEGGVDFVMFGDVISTQSLIAARREARRCR